MTQGSCAHICKWIVILFNVILTVVGLALFGGGFYLRVTAGEVIGSEFIFVIALCMGIGTLTVFAVCFGDYGSSKENKICLSLYGGLLILLATASVIGGIVAYVRDDEFEGHVLEFYGTIYFQYMEGRDVFRGFMLKVFHNALKCCGAGGFLHTLVGATDICPPETFWGINITPACTRDIVDIQANSVLFMFLGIAGVLILPLVCASFIWQQLSHPVLVSPPYIPLSPKKLSSGSPPPTPGPLSSPPPYTEHVVKVECI